jgi:hypothetical protein
MRSSGATVPHAGDGLLGQLSTHLFWDVDRAGVDLERHRAFIIVRTMERGNFADVIAVWHHYGSQAVQEALMQARSLEARTLFFFANQFGVRPGEFRAYRDGSSLDTGGW